MDSMTVTTDDGVDLHVAGCGAGPDVVVLSGGPGCVHYLADEQLWAPGVRWWFPDPRGVAGSGGGPHDMARALADLECVRGALGLDRWLVLGHSWGSDLAIRYALDHPPAVSGVIGIAGHGFHRDRDWSAAYQAGLATEEAIEIAWVPGVHAALSADFRQWIHEPRLWRRLADCAVPMRIVAAGGDIRPCWPLEQIAELVPRAEYETVDGARHDFWATEPDRWRAVTERAVQELDRA